MALSLSILTLLPSFLTLLPRLEARSELELVETIRRQLMQDNYDYMDASDSTEITFAPLNEGHPSRRDTRRGGRTPRRRLDAESDLIPEPDLNRQSELAPPDIRPRRIPQRSPPSPASRRAGDLNRIDDDAHSGDGTHRRMTSERGPPVHQRDLFYYADDTHFADTNAIDNFVNFDKQTRTPAHKVRDKKMKINLRHDVYRRFGQPDDNNDHHDVQTDHGDHGDQAGDRSAEHTEMVDYGAVDDVTTLRYKILEVPAKEPSGRRSGGGGTRRFLQEERPDGVSIVKLGDGPFPEFRLPPERRQYMPVPDAVVDEEPRRNRAPLPSATDTDDDSPLPPGGLPPNEPLVPPGMPDLTPELPDPLPPDSPRPDTPLDTRRLAELLGDDILNMVD